MTSKLPQFNFRCEQETIDKIKYIADKEVRSASQEIVIPSIFQSQALPSSLDRF